MLVVGVVVNIPLLELIRAVQVEAAQGGMAFQQLMAQQVEPILVEVEVVLVVILVQLLTLVATAVLAS